MRVFSEKCVETNVVIHKSGWIRKKIGGENYQRWYLETLFFCLEHLRKKQRLEVELPIYLLSRSYQGERQGVKFTLSITKETHVVPVRHHTSLVGEDFTNQRLIVNTQKIIQFAEIINKQGIFSNNKWKMGETAVEQAVKIDDSTEQTEKVGIYRECLLLVIYC